MKLRHYFNLLLIGLLLVWGLMVYATTHSVPLVSGILVVSICILAIYLLFFYKKVVHPLQNISNGMDLLKEQDFSSRLRKVGQFEADRIVDIFNKMMEQLKNERLHLREQNKFLDLLIKASPMGVLVLNYDDQIADLNPAALTILGVEHKQELLGQSMHHVKPKLRIRLSEVPLHETRVLHINDGTVYKCTHESFIDQGFPRSFYLMESLTQEVRLAEKKAYEQVIRMISHEVNNTTAGIISTLDVVEQALADSAEKTGSTENNDMQEALRICMERSYNMSQFITNFANVVKIPQANLQIVNLNERVAESIRFMEVMCNNQQIKLEFTPDEEMGNLPLDILLFDQVLQNIIKNSAESIGTAGIIHLATNAKMRTLTITDNGKGISKEAENKLFSPFFSTKPTGQGIGLMFIQEVLTQHNCLYSLQTGEDGLTRFTLFFSSK